MKCKNWSNKLNNFVVRKLKSFKINGQQQVLTSTMPAMSNEKSTPISLDESNFDEINKMKEQLGTPSTSSSSSSSTASSVTSTTASSKLLNCCCNNSCRIHHTNYHHHHHHNQYHHHLHTNISRRNSSNSCGSCSFDGVNRNDLFTENGGLKTDCCCNYDDNCCNSMEACGGISMLSSSSSISTTNNLMQQQQQQQHNRIQLSNNGSNNINNLNCCHNGDTYKISTLTTQQEQQLQQQQQQQLSLITATNKSRHSINNFIKNNTTNCNCNSIKLLNNKINSMSSATAAGATAISSSSSASSPISLSSSSSTVVDTTETISTDTNRLNCNLATNKLQQQQQNDARKTNGISSNKMSNSQTITSAATTTPTTTTTTKTSTSQQPNGATSNKHHHNRSNGPPKKSVNDFIFGKYIGEGSFSTVYLASDIHTRKEYAIKVCEKTHIIREKKQEYIKREREVMHLVSNVLGFVNLYCTFQDESRLYFAMTHAKNGDLLPYINKVGSFDLECTQHYAAELVLACEKMHKRGIIHRDLKPENILLDENMHTLIADFGSSKIIDLNHPIPSTTMQTKNSCSSSSSSDSTTTTTSTNAKKLSLTTTSSQRNNQHHYNHSRRNNHSEDDDDDDDNVNHEGSNNDENDVDTDDMDDANQRNHYHHRQQQYRRRKCSFVGTAQYVTPEVLQNGPITRSVDLWALGCIIYQMISGLPPFRGTNDYFIFKEILGLNLVFPEGFDSNAEDLVRKLLKLNPAERLGAQDKFHDDGIYESIRQHPFFDGIDWDCVRDKQPPQIYPYLPGVNKDEELRSQYRVPEHLEPGLDNMKLTRLLGLSLLGFEAGNNKTEIEGDVDGSGDDRITDLNDETNKQKRLEAQKSTDNWDAFAEGEIILKKGFINKRKGLFARKRMLLLTTGPRLIYIDPVQMVKKGEIPWSSELRVEIKSFKIFFVHTPNRTYYLEDPEGYALNWAETIENIRKTTYSN